MIRYTDRDCYAAMIRLAGHYNALPGAEALGVSIPTGKSWTGNLEALAARFGVPVRRWGSPECSDGPRLILDYAPSCYGGGVRPAICQRDATGEMTPRWWKPSAGLGPGAVPRKEFCYIVSAVEEAFAEAFRIVASEVPQ